MKRRAPALDTAWPMSSCSTCASATCGCGCDGTRGAAAHRAAVSRAGGARHRVPAARLAGRGMVLPGWRAGLRGAVLPGAPAAHAPRAQDDRRGGGEQRQLADADPAPRGRPRHRLRLPAAPPRALARAVWPRLAPLRARSIAPGRPAATTCSTWASGTRRRIRPRILPRPSRSGCNRVPPGAAAMPRGRPGASSSTWRRWPPKSDRHRPAVAARDRDRSRSRTTAVTLREHYRRKRRAEHRRHRALADSLLRKVFASKADGAQPARCRRPRCCAALKASVRTHARAARRRRSLRRRSSCCAWPSSAASSSQLYQRGSRRELMPKLRATLVRMARGYISSDELRLRL